MLKCVGKIKTIFKITSEDTIALDLCNSDRVIHLFIPKVGGLIELKIVEKDIYCSETNIRYKTIDIVTNGEQQNMISSDKINSIVVNDKEVWSFKNQGKEEVIYNTTIRQIKN